MTRCFVQIRTELTQHTLIPLIQQMQLQKAINTDEI